MAYIIGKPGRLLRVKECLILETNIDTVLAEKMLQFKLPAALSVRVPTGEAQAQRPTFLLRRAAIFGHDKDYGLQDSPRSS